VRSILQADFGQGETEPNPQDRAQDAEIAGAIESGQGVFIPGPQAVVLVELLGFHVGVPS
jgi:hypothetical protein